MPQQFLYPLAWEPPTTLLDGLPHDELDVVIRTCEFDVPAVLDPLFRICQFTPSDPPATTLLLDRVTFNGCTSTVAAAVAEKTNCNTNNRTSVITQKRPYVIT